MTADDARTAADLKGVTERADCAVCRRTVGVGSHVIGSHDWWASGADFRLIWPRLTVYRPADLHPRVVWNRYPHNIIGAAVVLFRRSWSFQWKGTRR